MSLQNAGNETVTILTNIMQLDVEEEMAGRLEKNIGPTVHVSIYKKAEVVRKKGALVVQRNPEKA